MIRIKLESGKHSQDLCVLALLDASREDEFIELIRDRLSSAVSRMLEDLEAAQPDELPSWCDSELDELQVLQANKIRLPTPEEEDAEIARLLELERLASAERRRRIRQRLERDMRRQDPLLHFGWH